MKKIQLYEKIKAAIVKWFQDILGITELKEQLRQEKVKNTQMHIRLYQMQTTLDIIMKDTKVGMDINGIRNPSWAVVCVRGKAEYIKLFTFEERDIREIRNFLRSFPERNVTIDYPRGNRRMFFD